MFEIQTRQDVLKRLLQDFKTIDTNGMSTHEGTFAFDTLSANAVEFEKSYAEMQLILDAAFPQTSWGQYLTMHAEAHGVIRKKATKSKVVVKLTGVAGTIVPKGVTVGTAEGKLFQTIETVTIGNTGDAIANVESEEIGKDSNVNANTITEIITNVDGLKSVINEEVSYDGFDEENDTDLLQRLLFKVRQPATSGNVYHYMQWAQSVNGVGQVKVLPLWNGAGTVKVLLVDVNNESANTSLLDRVKAVIAKEAPIGATVTVTTPTIMNVNISFRVTKGQANNEAVKRILNEEFKRQTFSMNYISYANIGKALLANAETGIIDYSDLRVNGGTTNITITDDQLPRVNEVTING